MNPAQVTPVRVSYVVLAAAGRLRVLQQPKMLASNITFAADSTEQTQIEVVEAVRSCLMPYYGCSSTRHLCCSWKHQRAYTVVQEEKPAEEEVPDIKVDAKTVKELRGTSGAGMMDCKKALKMCNNDLEEAAVRTDPLCLKLCRSMNY